MLLLFVEAQDQSEFRDAPLYLSIMWALPEVTKNTSKVHWIFISGKIPALHKHNLTGRWYQDVKKKTPPVRGGVYPFTQKKGGT
jgi:hypothetical protein